MYSNVRGPDKCRCWMTWGWELLVQPRFFQRLNTFFEYMKASFLFGQKRGINLHFKGQSAETIDFGVDLNARTHSHCGRITLCKTKKVKVSEPRWKNTLVQVKVQLT